MAIARLMLLGGFELRLADGEALGLLGQKDRALLAVLALPAGATHARDKLASLLWSDRGDPQARDSLKHALTKLRQCLPSGGPASIVADRLTVKFDPASVTIDVAEFERLVREGTPPALEQAIALYRGDLLDGIGIRDPAFEEWLLVERQRLRHLFEGALARQVAQSMADGTLERAATAAQRLLALDPLREEACRALMQIHAERGETAQALKLYDALRDRLQGELGVKPAPETTQHYDAILNRRIVAAAPAHDPSPRELPKLLPEAAASAPRLAVPDKPSIAVLPFENLSDDPEQQYFSDGITEDIITELSRFHSLFVIAGNSSFRYRGHTADLTHVGRELGVQSIVEGSVRRSNDHVRVSAQLVDAATGKHLWADRYDREMQDIFAVQEDLAQAIAATIENRIAASGAQRSRRKPTSDLKAYDYFLQGRESIDRRQQPEIAVQLLQHAIELDPEFAQAHAWMSHAFLVMFNRDLGAETLQEGAEHARRALELDESDAWGHRAVGFAHMFAGQHELAGLHLDRAVALNPTDVRITLVRALWLTFAGRGDEAVRSLEGDLRRDPFPPALFWGARGNALFQTGQYEKSIQSFAHIQRQYAWDYYYLAAAHAHLGQIDKARGFIAEIQRVRPDFVLGHVELTEKYKNRSDLDRLLDGLRKTGLPES
jgi:TolB-like protein/DNA-binding SARP family transcriptional activator/predicted Zn-dependent protease